VSSGICVAADSIEDAMMLMSVVVKSLPGLAERCQ